MNIKIRKSDLKRFGAKIRERRTALDMTLEELAEMVNRSDREIRDIELGKVEPKLQTALLLCVACQVDIGELKEFVTQEESSYA